MLYRETMIVICRDVWPVRLYSHIHLFWIYNNGGIFRSKKSVLFTWLFIIILFKNSSLIWKRLHCFEILCSEIITLMFCPLCAHLYLCSLAWETYAKWTELFFFAQTRKGNTRIRIKFDIYFVNDEKVLQKQGVLNFDNKDQ